jgi:hypothetical protein
MKIYETRMKETLRANCGLFTDFLVTSALGKTRLKVRLFF